MNAIMRAIENDVDEDDDERGLLSMRRTEGRDFPSKTSLFFPELKSRLWGPCIEDVSAISLLRARCRLMSRALLWTSN